MASVAALPDAAGVDQAHAVGRKAGRLVQTAVRQYPHVAARQILHTDTIVGSLARDQRQRAPVGRGPWPRIIGRAEGDSLHALVRGDVGPIDLRAAGSVRGEIQTRAIRAPGRLGVDRRIVGDARQGLRRQVEHEDVEIAARSGQRQRQAPPVRRPGRSAVHARARRDLPALARAQLLHEHRRHADSRTTRRPAIARRPTRPAT